MSSCSCSTVAGLSGLSEAQRYLTPYETGLFLARHPIVFTMVTETDALIHAGLYNYNYNPYTDWNLPGVIPPWGIQVSDSSYGYVVIYPSPGGPILYSGFTAYNSQINKPEYEENPVPDNWDCKLGIESLNICFDGALVLVAVGAAAVLYVATKKKGGRK